MWFSLVLWCVVLKLDLVSTSILPSPLFLLTLASRTMYLHSMYGKRNSNSRLSFHFISFPLLSIPFLCFAFIHRISCEIIGCEFWIYVQHIRSSLLRSVCCSHVLLSRVSFWYHCYGYFGCHSCHTFVYHVEISKIWKICPANSLLCRQERVNYGVRLGYTHLN